MNEEQLTKLARNLEGVAMIGIYIVLLSALAAVLLGVYALADLVL